MRLDVFDLLWLVSACVVIYGLYLITPPAAYVGGGVIGVVIGVMGSMLRRPRGTPPAGG